LSQIKNAYQNINFKSKVKNIGKFKIEIFMFLKVKGKGNNYFMSFLFQKCLPKL